MGAARTEELRVGFDGAVKRWTMSTLGEKLLKIGAKVVTHARCVIFQMAEAAVPRMLFAVILECIRRLRRSEIGVARSGWAGRPLSAAAVRTSRAEL